MTKECLGKDVSDHSLSEYKFLRFLFYNPALVFLCLSFSFFFSFLSFPIFITWSLLRITLLPLLPDSFHRRKVSVFSFGCTVMLPHQHWIQGPKHHSWQKLTPSCVSSVMCLETTRVGGMEALHHYSWEHLQQRNYLKQYIVVKIQHCRLERWLSS